MAVFSRQIKLAKFAESELGSTWNIPRKHQTSRFPYMTIRPMFHVSRETSGGNHFFGIDRINSVCVSCSTRSVATSMPFCFISETARSMLL